MCVVPVLVDGVCGAERQRGVGNIWGGVRGVADNRGVSARRLGPECETVMTCSSAASPAPPRAEYSAPATGAWPGGGGNEPAGVKSDGGQESLRRAWAQIQSGRYAEAVQELSGRGGDSVAAAVPLRLARNLAALERHRPQVLHRVKRAGVFEAMQRYPLATTPAGHAVPSKRKADGSTVLITAGPDPRASARAAMDQLAEACATGEPVAVADLLDGHLLSALAASPPALLLNMKQGVEIVEPKTHLLIACLMLHDWWGEAGPIADRRFNWHVGPKAFSEYSQRLVNESMLLPPRVVLGRPRRSAALRRVIDFSVAGRRKRQDQWQARTDEHYRTFRPDALTVGTKHRPKVLLITSRFTTVLQHSTADCEAAFKKLGWRTRLLIEPTDTHRMTTTAMQQALATFRPDLVFSIDTLRAQTEVDWPEKLPYVCWIQDQLDRLNTPEAGASVTPYDFVLSVVSQMYTRQWGYPGRQMVAMPKLTRPPVLPESWAQDGPDLTYVSTASQRLEDLLVPFANHELLRRCAAEVVKVYEAGGSLATLWHMGRLVDGVCRETGRRLETADRARAINALFHPLNNALYRQQALRWVADAADELGLELALYGPGWDRHPEFAKHARGPVAYGPELERLTRASKINLQIIPSLCTHQRMLDGLVAGGFFLVRSFPGDTAMPRLLEALPPGAQTLDEARAQAGADPSRLEAALREAECFTSFGSEIDPVAWMREVQQAELIGTSGTLLPGLEEVSFADAASFRDRLTRFIDDAPARRALAREQRESVQHRLSYTAGLRRALARIGRLLSETQAQQNHTPTRAVQTNCRAA